MTNDLMRNNEFLARLTNLMKLIGPPDQMHFCVECGDLEILWRCADECVTCQYRITEDCEFLIVDADHIETFDSMWFALRGFCETYDIEFVPDSFEDAEEIDDVPF